VTDVAGEYVANNNTVSLSQGGRMIEHVVIYQFDASADTELSLAVDEHVWVSDSFLFVTLVFLLRLCSVLCCDNADCSRNSCHCLKHSHL